MRIAFQKLIEQQEALRIIVVDDFAHVFQGDLSYDIELHDLRGRSLGEIEENLEQVRNRMSCHLFEESHWPRFALQASLISQNVTCVHLCVDNRLLSGLSSSRLCFELNQLYEETEGNCISRGQAFEKAKAYWLGQLNQLPAAPELPIVDEPAVSLRFTSLFVMLGESVWSQLKLNAELSKITVEALLIAAYVDVIRNWSRRGNFTILLQNLAQVPAGAQSNSLLGTHLNFSFLKVDHRTESSFLQRAEEVQSNRCSEADCSLISCLEVMSELGLLNATSPVLFTNSLRENIQGKQSGIEASFDSLSPEQAVARLADFGLDCEVSSASEGVKLTWTYRESLFPSGMIEQMFETFVELVYRLSEKEGAGEGIVTSRLPLAQSRQREYVNSTGVSLPSTSVQQLIRRGAMLHPTRPAVESTSGSLSYAELWLRAEQLARRLIEAGATVGRPIPIVLDKSREQIIAVLGIIIAGAPYSPIDSSLPSARINLLLEDLGANIIVSHRRIQHAWKEGETIVWIEALEQDEIAPINITVGSDDPAYVIYTSGSTGRPKGVVVSHAALLNFVLDAQWRFQIRSTDKVIALTALHHDLSVFDVFATLVAGATIIMPDIGRSRDLSHWADLLRSFGVTIWNSVPAMMQVFLMHLDDVGEDGLSAMRVVILGGDVIPPQLPEKIERRGKIAVFSIGGPTETTVWNITFETGQRRDHRSLIPYGKPISNTKYFVLDEHYRECPDWVVGELHCSGLSLALGYWGDPQLTAKKFVYRPGDTTRLYATGDLGRYSSDGNIEILGRVDNQIKLSGIRIEPAEIEMIINTHPDVVSSVVTVNKDANGRNHLVAYLVTSAESTASSTDILVFLRSRLPSQMIPARVERLKSFPLTSNGKVDRKGLADCVLKFSQR